MASTRDVQQSRASSGHATVMALGVMIALACNLMACSDPPQGSQGKTCCTDNTTECKACEKGQTLTQFCIANPQLDGCELCRDAPAFLAPAQLMACPCKPLEKTECMTEARYDDIVQSISHLMENHLSEECNAKSCEKADFAGCVLRMAGHDFMDFKDGEGGSDGCTDLKHPDNKGLPECLAHGDSGISLDDAYNLFCIEVSLADFLVIAAEAVMSIARNRAIAESSLSEASIDFRGKFLFGRTTNSFCTGAASQLPDPEESCSANERVFRQNLGFSWRQTAAIMGVHSLGRAQSQFSGYRGWWSDALNSRRFNNNYYVSLVTKGWIPERALPDVKGVPQPAKNQWQRADKGIDGRNEMMLNTDLCLLYKHKEDVLSAQRHDCCAWIAQNAFADGKFIMRQVVASNNDVMCGAVCYREGDLPCGGFETQKKACCPQRDPQMEDCGFAFGVMRPEGDAMKDVMDFAENEALWLEAFLDAWTKATTNGMKQLRPLVAANEAGLDSCKSA